ncbi:MAG: hypothetical protein HUU21_25230 [Polyangiaceae bacterium]|nr:hypothetical protein [Polyangiaceae bacterium]NUQ76851.1 hypothetical protein [Polyangiaceae bacterium]
MIAIIDPALLLTESAEGPLPPDEEKSLEYAVDDAARICRDQRAVIPAAEWYWNKLQREIVRPLHRQVTGSRLRQGLDALGRSAKPMALGSAPAVGKTRMWGIKPLFAWGRLPSEWFGVMERLLIGCAQQDEETVLITRLFPGRNLTMHAVGRTTLIEKTRWRLYVHVPGRAPRQIPCIRGPRNLAVPWTARFDEKLPDQGRFPFCPPKRWWRRDTKANRTYKSKPAWIDRYGNGWAQPGTGGDYHWDVFLEDPNLQDAVGLHQINVVAWGTTEKGKTPGGLHHVPDDKEPHLKAGCSWTCPHDD